MSPREVKEWAGLAADELAERWGREVRLYGKVDSTNRVARELAEAGAPSGTVVLAREQAEGRGRAGRRWFSPPGSLYLSLLLRPEAGHLRPLVSVLAGLGIVRELDRRFDGLEPALKWPNDLMVGDRKMGGILAEAGTEEGVPRWLVVGCGLNVRRPKEVPDELEAGAAWVEEHVEDAGLPGLADAVVRGLQRRLEPLPASLDASSLDLLDRYDWLQDRRVRVRQKPDEEGLVGVCVGIAPDGALLFRPDRGALRRLSSATLEPE